MYEVLGSRGVVGVRIGRSMVGGYEAAFLRTVSTGTPRGAPGQVAVGLDFDSFGG